MSSNKFDALGSDDSEVDDGISNHQQLEVGLDDNPDDDDKEDYVLG